MIEVPRAALTAGQIAEAAEFFSFGTNDLTQMAWGFSRDDVEGAFFSRYLEQGIFGVSPFESIDRDGVGRLVRIAVEEGRAARPDLKLGVCGEHGGDPDSVHFFHEVGLDYVSCSPFRVPVARLEAGRAAVERPAPTAADRRLILPRWAIRITVALVALGLLVFACTAGRVWWAARQDDRRASDVIVVLGASEFDGRPSVPHEDVIAVVGVAGHEGVIQGVEPHEPAVGADRRGAAVRRRSRWT